MVGALWTGISGLASQQQALDNESNNIANVNTVGFKASRISFADQMYQDRIGKGSKILDSEKLYTQGNLKLTGVDYDLALSGEGFFVVKNTRLSGSSEDNYTRAGNFRMGDNGTLQDAAGNEVQGWPMVAIDPKETTSTNPNVTMFNDNYTKLLSSKIIKHATFVETITSRATDYTSTAKTDSATIFSGAGLKSKSSKVSDIEEAIKNYSTWLQRLSEEPDGSSATSTAQVSQVNFKSGTNGLASSEGDQIYVYIDGTKHYQNYVSTVASDEFKESFLDSTDTGNMSVSTTTNANDTITVTAADLSRYSLTIDGETVFYDSDSNATLTEIVEGLEAAIKENNTLGTTYSLTTDTGAGTIQLDAAPTSISQATYASNLTIDYDIAASRVETYKALANKLSEVTGLKAYLVEESSGGVDTDFLESGETYRANTNDYTEMLKGIIQIESLIPGVEFKITEVGESSGDTTNIGDYQTSVLASAGSGIGALESSKEALARLITGNQRDVYTASDLGLDGTSSFDFTYGLTIYDKELGANIPVPGDGSTNPAKPYKIFMDGITSVDDMVDYINGTNTYINVDDTDDTIQTTSSFVLSDYVKASNVNGALVIETLDSNYDVEFSGSLKVADSAATDDGTATLAATYTPVDKNSDYSGRAGAGAEFIELINKVDQTATKGSLQLRLDTLGISESAFGSFSVDDAGLITMTQDGADFVIGQVAIALFNNNRGLEPVGDNLLAKSNNSGDPIYNLNNNKTARIESKTLELSTADLSESLVNLMVFQRAFEANAKSITTSDTILNTLINLKR
ncbi:MAG: flagellar hook-basal body complex protein [Halarcobacter sp.]